ncbi:MAG: pyridoxal phosphate-dependent aminotransferase [Clostridia bacterium]|nr:pyridoxal phosphate-dependent aminotransferase [Clostridia bacterium]
MKINEKMYSLGSRRSIIREIFEYCKTRAAEIGADRVFDFSIGNPSVEPPREIAEAIARLIETESATLLHGYTSAQGDYSTRLAIAEDINSRFGTALSPDNLYMTCGAAASLTISLRALMNAGDECILFAPFFTEYRVFVENAGGVPVVSAPEAGSFQIDISDLAGKITERTKAVIVNSPNNPSGVVYTDKTLRALTDLLKEKEREYSHPIYLIADEPYRELVYGGASVPYLMNYYDDTLVCYSYSKALSLPGERIGYIAVSPKMQEGTEVYLAVCGAGRSLGYVCAPSLFQRVIRECIGAKVDIGAYEKNRDLLLNALTEYGFECVRPDGAFYLFVKSPEPDAYKFFERAKRREILVVPCDDFGTPGYVRIAYCVSRERIENSLPAFEALAREYGLKG